MKLKSFFLAPLLLLTTHAAETPQFRVYSAVFVPQPPAGERPYLREDEESGETSQQLIIEVSANYQANDKTSAAEVDKKEPDIYDITFDGELIGPDKNPLPADVDAYSYDDGTIFIKFECITASKVHPTYTLKGTLEFNTADDEETKANEKHHKYTINQKIRLNGK